MIKVRLYRGLVKERKEKGDRKVTREVKLNISILGN